MAKKQQNQVEKDKFSARMSLIVSLGFWIPLFNIGLAIVAIYLSIKSLRQINRDPDKYGGLWYAVFALVLSISTLILSLVFILIYTYRKVTCDVALTL